MYGYYILSRRFATLEEVKPQACRNKVCFGGYNHFTRIRIKYIPRP